MSGASWTGGNYLPDVTSYDYEAPLDETGHSTPKFFAYREVFAKYSSVPLPPVPASPPVIELAPFAGGHATSLWDHLPKPIRSDTPLTMEALGQAYSYIVYRKVLDHAADGDLVLPRVSDCALVYLDG